MATSCRGPTVAPPAGWCNPADMPMTPDGTPARAAILDAYVRWLSNHDDADEWVWDVVHDGVWWYGEPLEMLAFITDVAQRLAGNSVALAELGAGPLEDLLGGDAETMAAAVREAGVNPAFREALRNVNGVKHGEEGYEELRRGVEC